MFLGKYFPPSMVTKLRKEITNFCQRLDESLFEAWELYKLSIGRCLNHNMLPITQIYIFYNGLTLRHCDTINAAAGGTFMKRRPEECYDLIKNMTANHNDWDTSIQRSESSSSITSSFDMKIVALKAEMAEINKNLMKVLQINQQVKAVAHNYETYGGTHSYNDCPATVGQTQNMNIASFSGLGTLPSNTITNPKEDLKGITTQSGNANKGPTVPTTYSLPNVMEHETEVTKDTPVEAPVGAPKPNPKPSIPYPSRLHDQKLRDKANDQKEKFFKIFQDLDFNISFADALILMPKKAGDPEKFLIPCDFLGMDECLALADLDASINLMPLSVWNKLSLPELSPTCMTLELADRLISRPVGVAEDVYVKVGTFYFLADFVVVDVDADPRVPLILERSFLKTRRALIDVYEGELTLRVGKEAEVLGFSVSGNPTPSMEPIVSNSSPTLTPFGDKLKVVEPTNEKSSIDEPLVVKLKDIPPHLEYAFLEGDDKLPVIIAKDLKVKEKTDLIKVLKSHKQALAWKLSDIKGIDPEFCTHKILMEDDFKPAVQYQRRVNTKIHEVIKKEVLKLLDAELIYPISDSPWVSPVHCVPKKGGST
nr:DNA-directed DNA polymerase [Tanacetum cinerariifolium]